MLPFRNSFTSQFKTISAAWSKYKYVLPCSSLERLRSCWILWKLLQSFASKEIVGVSKVSGPRKNPWTSTDTRVVYHECLHALNFWFLNISGVMRSKSQVPSFESRSWSRSLLNLIGSTFVDQQSTQTNYNMWKPFCTQLYFIFMFWFTFCTSWLISSALALINY